MPTEAAMEVFLKAKAAILDQLYDKYGVPKIDASLLQPLTWPPTPVGEGRFAEVFEVPLVGNDSSEPAMTVSHRPLQGHASVAAKIMKEDRIDDLLACIPPSAGISAAEKQNRIQQSVEKLLKYYERECVVWQKCSGDPQKARENSIVELLGLVESYHDSYLPVFISRFIPEGNVLSLITENRVPMKSRKSDLSDRCRILIVSDIANALRFLHDIGIAHRDINPCNILIENSGERYVGLLGDFGSSRMFEGDLLQNASSTISQEQYAPPEYLLIPGAQHEDKGSGDIWALGCTFLQILQEKEPWSPYPPELFKQMLREYQMPVMGESVQWGIRRINFRHVDERCYEVMKKCWRKERTERISAADLHLELIKLAENV